MAQQGEAKAIVTPPNELFEKCPWILQFPYPAFCGLCWMKQNWFHDNNLQTKYVEAFLVESHHHECPRADHDGERHLILSRPPGTAIAP